LPIPIKNLMVARAQEFEVVNPFAYKNVKNNTDYVENFFSFWINFKKLYKVEYFEGFQTVNKQVLIKNPTWTELTINKLQTSKKNILCRLQKYKMEKFESYFPDVEKLEMPLIDQYFFISPDGAITLIDAIVTEVQKKQEEAQKKIEEAKNKAKKVKA